MWEDASFVEMSCRGLRMITGSKDRDRERFLGTGFAVIGLVVGAGFACFFCVPMMLFLLA